MRAEPGCQEQRRDSEKYTLLEHQTDFAAARLLGRGFLRQELGQGEQSYLKVGMNHQQSRELHHQSWTWPEPHPVFYPSDQSRTERSCLELRQELLCISNMRNRCEALLNLPE